MNFSVYGKCDKAHYHNYRFLNMISPLPESMQASEFDKKYHSWQPFNCKIYAIRDCPCDLPSTSPTSVLSSLVQNQPNPATGSGDQSELILGKVIKALEENLLNSIQKKQTEFLNSFKNQTDNIIKDFKDLHDNLRWEVHSVTMSIATHHSQMQKFTEQIKQLEYKIEELLPNPDASSTESEESEDILQEIEAIKHSDRTFMEYRPLTGQYWEVEGPIVFQITICDTTLNAIYDPRVSKSIMSDDILFSDEDTFELDYDKVFYVPWWFPKLQTCRKETTVKVMIDTFRSHSLTLNVAINPLWNKTVVLGFNFGQKFIDKVNDDNCTITLRDDSDTSYCLNFKYYN